MRVFRRLGDRTGLPGTDLRNGSRGGRDGGDDDACSGRSRPRRRLHIMRQLLFAALLILTVLLVAHGLFFADQAQELYDKAATSPTPNFQSLITEYPYSDAARRAVYATVDRQASKLVEGGLPDTEKLKQLGSTLLETARQGVSEKPPYIMPFTAAVIGLAALALALLLPATRFRGLALLGLIFGAAAAIPGLLNSDDQAAIAAKFPLAKTMISELPRIAQGLCLLAGLVLAVRVRRKADHAD